MVYPEVTGYYIPTLLENGRLDLAMKYAEYLVQAQDVNGAFGLPGESFAFDTGMVIRGWLALYPRIDKTTKFHTKILNSLWFFTNHIGHKTMKKNYRNLAVFFNK